MKRILVISDSQGNRYNVKSEYTTIAAVAKEKGADVLAAHLQKWESSPTDIKKLPFRKPKGRRGGY